MDDLNDEPAFGIGCGTWVLIFAFAAIVVFMFVVVMFGL